jgi:hypothetical protein
MNCPNCFEPFRLVADYASHLQRCSPREMHAEISDSLLATLNAATESLDLELGAAEAEAAAELQPIHAG